MTASWTYITDATLTKDLMGLRGVRIDLQYGHQYDVTREHWYILEHHPRNIAAHIRDVMGKPTYELTGEHSYYYFQCGTEYVAGSVLYNSRDPEATEIEWYWVVDDTEKQRIGKKSLYFDDPQLNPWFSRFLLEFHEHVLGSSLPRYVIHPEIQLMMKAQEDQQALHSEIGEMGIASKTMKM